MKFRHDAASEAQLLVQLVEKTKTRTASPVTMGLRETDAE
jgi:hypothetical protein